MIAPAGKLAAMAVGIIAVALAPAGRATDDADRVLAASCNGCHVSAAAATGIPSLEGKSSIQLETLLLAYKRGTQPATLMDRIARGYSDGELRRLADVFGSAP